MGKIKLVLTDVDGTLVPVLKHEPSARVKGVIKRVQDAGVELTAATGRPYEMTKELFKHIGIRDLCIFDGGATIRRIETGEFVWKNWLSVNRIKEIVEIILPNCTRIDFSPDHRPSHQPGFYPNPVIYPFFARSRGRQFRTRQLSVPLSRIAHG